MDKKGRFILTLGFVNFSPWSVGSISVGSVAKSPHHDRNMEKTKAEKEEGIGVTRLYLLRSCHNSRGTVIQLKAELSNDFNHLAVSC